MSCVSSKSRKNHKASCGRLSIDLKRVLSRDMFQVVVEGRPTTEGLITREVVE